MSVVPDRPDLDGLTDGELAEERDFLLGSLRDLDAEHDAGDVDPHDYAALRDGYTARAAAVLRLLDLRAAGGTVGAGERTVVRTRRRGWRGPVAVIGIAAFAAGAGVLVAHHAGQRLPGDNISGSTPTSPSAKLLAQAQQQFGSGHLLDAIKTYDKVLAVAPTSAEALAYKGWLLRLAGSQGGDTALIDAGLTSIRKAEAVNPAYPDAHFFAGETLLRDKFDPRDAVVEFQEFLADQPGSDMAPEVKGELAAAQAALAAPSTTTAPAAPATTAPQDSAPATPPATAGP